MISAKIEAAKTKLIQSGLAEIDTTIGCSEQEIASVEEAFSLSLPKEYRDFLRMMGREAGKFLVGTDYSFPTLLEFREDAERLLIENHADFGLSLTNFVFMFHQGYTFLFFDCKNGSDDPPVFLYTESEAAVRQVGESFSEWLNVAIEDDIVAYTDLEGR